MDNANKSMKLNAYTYQTRNGEKSVEAISMFDINKAVMRCLVKNLAMFGLGLYIYAGEDLPEDIKDVARFNGVRFNMDYFDAMVSKIEELLLPEEGTNEELTKTGESENELNYSSKPEKTARAVESDPMKLRELLHAVNYDDIAAAADLDMGSAEFVEAHKPENAVLSRGILGYLRAASTQARATGNRELHAMLTALLYGTVLLREICYKNGLGECYDGVITGIGQEEFPSLFSEAQERTWGRKDLIYEGFFFVAMTESTKHYQNRDSAKGTFWGSVYLLAVIVDSLLEG
jgi:hypothetical protein